MFKILSKESTIFSIPTYIGVLLLGIITINYFEFTLISVISATIAFLGVALGYFTFNSVGLNNRSHLPLFIYTIINISLYPKMLDIGISWTILSNALFIYLLTHRNRSYSRKVYLLIGAIFALNFIVLPTVWPMLIFFLLHIISTSKKVWLNLFRFAFGSVLVGIAYFCIAYFLGYDSWNTDYLPSISYKYSGILEEIYYLFPIALLLIYSVIDYTMQYSKTSSSSKFKYAFLLLFIFAQLVIMFLYMGNSTQYLLIIALAVSIIISRAMHYMNRFIYQEIALWLVIISLVAYRYFHYFQFQI